MVIEKKERKKHIGTRVDVGTWVRIRELSQKNGVAESAVIRTILEDFFYKESQLIVDKSTTNK